MRPGKIQQNDLLFHPVHGLCRVDKLMKQNLSGQKVLCYSLVPKTMSKMKVRFVVAAHEAETSGFHEVISSADADKVLEYLRCGSGCAEDANQTWMLAKNVRSFSRQKMKPRDQRKRQLLEHSIKGLVGELSCAFNLSAKETAGRIEKSLGKTAKVDSLVLAALGRAAGD